MPFTKYGSIEHSDLWDKNYQNNYMGTVEAIDEQRFQVTEKIHGANLGIRCDGQDVILQSRNQDLNLSENWMNIQEIYDKYASKVHTLFNTIPKAREIILFGELYGPKLGHGIYYSDTRKFIAFDLKVTYQNQTTTMLSYNQTIEYLSDVGIPYLPVLLEGTYDECIQYVTPLIECLKTMLANLTNSEVSLPDPENSNLLGRLPTNHQKAWPEGWVIKSTSLAINTIQNDGNYRLCVKSIKSPNITTPRLVKKEKNIAFDERPIIHTMYKSIISKNPSTVEKKSKQKSSIPTPQKLFFAAINPPRIASVVSKITSIDLTNKNWMTQSLVDCVITDALEDVNSTTDTNFELTPELRESAKKKIYSLRSKISIK